MNVSATSNPVAVALAWTLLNAVWQAPALLLIYVVSRWATRNASLRSTIAQATLIALLVVQGATFAYLVVERRTFEPLRELMGDSTFGIRDGVDAKPVTLEPMAPRSATTVVLIAARQFLPWIALAWCVAAGVQLFGAARDMIVLRRAIASAAPVAAALAIQFERLAGRMGIRKPLAFLWSGDVSLPATTGWIRPVVLLPEQATLPIPLADLELLVAHEVAHVVRGDFAQGVVRATSRWLFAWHPAVRALARYATNDSEEAADELATAALGSRREYARALLHAEEQRRLLALTLSAGGGAIGERIKRLTMPAPGVLSRGRRARIGAALVVGPILLAVVSMLLAADAVDRSESEWLRSRSLATAVLETIAQQKDNPTFGEAVSAALTARRMSGGADLTDRASLARVADAAICGFDATELQNRFRDSFEGTALGARRRVESDEFGSAIARSALAQSLMRESAASTVANDRDRFARAALLVSLAIPFSGQRDDGPRHPRRSAFLRTARHARLAETPAVPRGPSRDVSRWRDRPRRDQSKRRCVVDGGLAIRGQRRAPARSPSVRLLGLASPAVAASGCRGRSVRFHSSSSINSVPLQTPGPGYS